MTDKKSPLTEAGATSHSWLWFVATVCCAMYFMANGKTLLAAGFLMMSIFSLFNSPTGPAPPRTASAPPLLVFSWVCGILGTGAILTAAVVALL